MYLKILVRENLFYRKKENWDQITPSNFQGHVAPHKKIMERRGPSRGIIQKCEPHERNPCARRVAWDLTKSVCKLKKIQIMLHFTFLLKPGQRWRPLQNLQRNENSWLVPEHQCTHTRSCLLPCYVDVSLWNWE